MRKWEYIVKALENLKATENVVNAAKAIDQRLVEIGLSYDTPQWKEYKNNPEDETVNSLYHLINSPKKCSACTDEKGEVILCSDCKLSQNTIYCTPPETFNNINVFCVVKDYLIRK